MNLVDLYYEGRRDYSRYSSKIVDILDGMKKSFNKDWYWTKDIIY